MSFASPGPAGSRPVAAARLDRLSPILYGLAVALLITAPYEAYLTLPHLHGHSLFSLLARVGVFILPLWAVVRVARGTRQGLWPLVWLVLWLAVVAVTWLKVSVHDYYTFYYLWTQVGGVAMVLAAWLLARRPGWLQGVVWLGFPVFVFASGVVALWEIHTGHHLGASLAFRGRPVPSAFYFDPNSLGAAMAIALPFVVLLGVLRPRRWVWLAGGGLALFALVVLLATGSRGGEVAVLLECLAAPLVLPARARRQAFAAIGLLILAGLALGLVVHLLPPGHLPFALDKFRRLTHLVTRLGSLTHVNPNHPTSLVIRLALLKGGWLALQHHPWGLGPRGAEAYYGYWVNHGAPFNTYGVIDPHNMWLEVAMDFGWLGLALYVTFYLSLLRTCYRARRSANPLRRYLAGASFLALIGFVVGSTSPSSVMVGFHVMWLLYGLACAVPLLSDQGRPAAITKPGAPA